MAAGIKSYYQQIVSHCKCRTLDFGRAVSLRSFHFIYDRQDFLNPKSAFQILKFPDGPSSILKFVSNERHLESRYVYELNLKNGPFFFVNVRE